MDDEFNRTYISLGMIIRLPIERIEDFKDHIADFPDAKGVYQKLSFGNLWIGEKDRDGNILPPKIAQK